MIYFVTTNINKFKEVRSVIEDVEQLSISLSEIQDIDAKEIVKKKLLEALEHTEKEIIVEDTSLYLDCLEGLPGPFVKWFPRHLLVEITEKMGNNKARAKTIIGYAENKENMYFFEGEIHGNIVKEKGESFFGWDPIFVPKGESLTFAQMGTEKKNKISMRRIALDKLKEFLNK
ncbi:MAG TPA: non-canonical purine NTP pyrophosphatase [Candidatus Pacearchaeota archaeon]|nr:non-canonical purine NTP pyrophosphatase [Candidatus Pacearchaeota archaeon]HQM24609.1 non-canonical purine NTP pyrophosphatase [Candidatus Pacearchaeota archaeon]